MSQVGRRATGGGPQEPPRLRYLVPAVTLATRATSAPGQTGLRRAAAASLVYEWDTHYRQPQWVSHPYRPLGRDADRHGRDTAELAIYPLSAPAAEQPVQRRVAHVERTEDPPERLVPANLVGWASRDVPPGKRHYDDVQHASSREHELVWLASFHARQF